MILAIDVGNTNIIIGVIDAKKTYFVERITTTIGKPNLEYAVALKSILEIYHIAPDQLDGAIVSSVVPPLNRTILAAIRKITGLNAMLVNSSKTAFPSLTGAESIFFRYSVTVLRSNS